MYRKYIKRILDIICAVLALVCFFWLYIIIAVLVLIKLGRPVFFVQKRPGKDEKIFKLYKFRTMSEARDKDGKLLPDEECLTKFGRWLRSTSLDEIPEFWNILKGDMSLIGPRPLSTVYLPYYSDFERHRHDVRPGLSGLAQINGRNNCGWEERFTYDVQYVASISCVSDVKIFLCTFLNVLNNKDVSVRKDERMDFDKYRIRQLEGKHELIR